MTTIIWLSQALALSVRDFAQPQRLVPGAPPRLRPSTMGFITLVSTRSDQVRELPHRPRRSGEASRLRRSGGRSALPPDFLLQLPFSNTSGQVGLVLCVQPSTVPISPRGMRKLEQTTFSL